MIPGSLVGALIVAALIPGAIYLTRTDMRRRPTRDPSTLEELITLATAGSLTLAGPLLVALIGKPKVVRRSVSTMENFRDSSDENIVQMAWLVLFVLGGSVLIAVVAAFVFNRLSDVNGVPDVWTGLLEEFVPGQILMVGVLMRDGRFIQGSAGGYSSSRGGSMRDLVLGHPISYSRNAETRPKLLSRRKVAISEREIVYFTTWNMKRPANQSAGRARNWLAKQLRTTADRLERK